MKPAEASTPPVEPAAPAAGEAAPPVNGEPAAVPAASATAVEPGAAPGAGAAEACGRGRFHHFGFVGFPWFMLSPQLATTRHASSAVASVVDSARG
ncbi:hypothetical protein [Streptomyces sp. NPDC001537]